MGVHWLDGLIVLGLYAIGWLVLYLIVRWYR